MSDTSETPSDPVRYCGYSQCGRILPVQTRPGRKSEYCKDRLWEPGSKTCKQMAEADRAAVKAAGLDAPLAAYREATAKFLPPLEAFLEQINGPLTDLVGTVRAVDTGALARIAEEEQIAVAAVNRAEQMTAERDKAQRERATALAEAKQAKEDRTVALRLQRDAEKERDRDVDAAWAKVVEYESQRAAAQAKADEVGANLTAQIARYDKLAEQTDTLRESNKKLSKANTALETSLKTAQDERAAAVQLAEQRAADVTAAGEAKAAAEATLETLRAELDRTLAELKSQKTAAAELQKTLAAEKNRADKLAAELTTATTAANQMRADLTTEQSTAEGLRTDLEQAKTDLEQVKAELARVETRVATVEELRALIAQGGTTPNS